VGSAVCASGQASRAPARSAVHSVHTRGQAGVRELCEQYAGIVPAGLGIAKRATRAHGVSYGFKRTPSGVLSSPSGSGYSTSFGWRGATLDADLLRQDSRLRENESRVVDPST